MDSKGKAKAGRKPKGEYAGKSAVFSTRITPDLRAMLEEEAERTGRSISQVVERRLRDSFDRPKRMERALGAKHVRALAYMVARVVSSLEVATGHAWNRDSFTFCAAREAVKIAMKEFLPAGDPVVPKEIKRRAAMVTENARHANKEAEASYMTTPESLGIIHALMFTDMLARDIEPRHDIYDREEHFSDDDQSLLPFIKRTLKEDDQ